MVDVIKADYRRADENRIDVLVEALCHRYRELTGKEPSTRFREELYNVVRFDG